MKTKLTRLAVVALGAATLVLGGATAASAATVPAHAPAAQPAGGWHLYGYFPSLAECQAAAIELASYAAFGGYQCSLTDGAHQQEALYVYF